jgi:hypothetical protein
MIRAEPPLAVSPMNALPSAIDSLNTRSRVRSTASITWLDHGLSCRTKPPGPMPAIDRGGEASNTCHSPHRPAD